MMTFLLTGMWRALLCAVQRRQDGVAGDVLAFRSPPPSPTVTAVLLTIGAAEIVAIELFVPWPWLRVILLALGVWSLLFIIAALVVSRTHPHLLTKDELVLRLYTRVVARIPRSDIRSAALTVTRDAAAPGLANGRLHLPGPSGETSVRLDLAHDVPAAFSRRFSGPAHQITLDVTTPRTLVGELTANTTAA